MGRLVKIYGSVRIASVKKISDADDKTWAWREGVVGRVGSLYLCKSGSLYHMIHRTVYNMLRTSKGAPKVENATLTLTTKNTEYVYEILKQGEI